MPNLPRFDVQKDLKRHMELKRRAEAAARRGQALLVQGKRKEAQAALDEAEECMEQAGLIEERYK